MEGEAVLVVLVLTGLLFSSGGASSSSRSISADDLEASTGSLMSETSIKSGLLLGATSLFDGFVGVDLVLVVLDFLLGLALGVDALFGEAPTFLFFAENQKTM